MVFNAVAVPQVAALLATGNAVIALLSLIVGALLAGALFITRGVWRGVPRIAAAGWRGAVDGQDWPSFFGGWVLTG